MATAKAKRGRRGPGASVSNTDATPMHLHPLSPNTCARLLRIPRENLERRGGLKSEFSTKYIHCKVIFLYIYVYTYLRQYVRMFPCSFGPEVPCTIDAAVQKSVLLRGPILLTQNRCWMRWPLQLKNERQLVSWCIVCVGGARCRNFHRQPGILCSTQRSGTSWLRWHCCRIAPVF
jgi:hypothetical protein